MFTTLYQVILNDAAVDVAIATVTVIMFVIEIAITTVAIEVPDSEG